MWSGADPLAVDRANLREARANSEQEIDASGHSTKPMQFAGTSVDQAIGILTTFLPSVPVSGRLQNLSQHFRLLVQLVAEPGPQDVVEADQATKVTCGELLDYLGIEGKGRSLRQLLSALSFASCRALVATFTAYRASGILCNTASVEGYELIEAVWHAPQKQALALDILCHSCETARLSGTGDQEVQKRRKTC